MRVLLVEGLAEQGESSLKISAVYQTVFAFRHMKRKSYLSPLKLPGAGEGGVKGAPKFMGSRSTTQIKVRTSGKSLHTKLQD